MCFSALINVITSDIFAATILIIVGPIIIALFTFYFYWKNLRRLARIKEEKRKSKVGSPKFGTHIPKSPIKSPISSISPQHQKEEFDFSKKVNQFDDFSIGSSPVKKTNDYKLDVKDFIPEKERTFSPKEEEQPKKIFDEEEKV